MMIRTLCVFMLTAAVLCPAQTVNKMSIVGQPKIEGGELVSREIRTADGVVCAGLIINSDLTGLAFQANDGIVKANVEKGRTFLFLSPDERKVIVACEGFVNLEIFLAEEGIRLKSGQVWSITVTGKKQSGLGFLSVSTQPMNASIRVLQFDQQTPVDSLKLVSGTYPIVISKEFHEPRFDTVEIKKDVLVKRSYNLRRLQGFLIIKAKDEENREIIGAEITLNGERIAEKTPFKKKVNADRYIVTLAKEGFLLSSDTIVLKDEEPESRDILLRRIGIVTFSGTPQASIVDARTGKELGSIPASGTLISQLRPQEYSLIYRLGRPVKKYTDIDVSLSGGLLYDAVHTTLDVPSDQVSTSFSIEQTDGKFFRFNMFGNDRIAHLTDGVELSTGFTPAEYSPSLITTVIGFPIKEPLSVGFSSIHAVLNYNPFSFSVNAYNKTHEVKLNDTLTYNFETANFIEAELDWVPFVLWEKFYPFIGGMYMNGRFRGTMNYGAYSLPISGYQITNDEETVYSTAGIVAGVLVRLPVLSMFKFTENEGYLPDLVLRMKYRHLLDTKAYQSSFSIQAGIAMRLPFLAGF